MGLMNFSIREAITYNYDDPEPGTVWKLWCDGENSKLPPDLSHLMWINVIDATMSFISPDLSWNPPDEYRIIDDQEAPTRAVERDLNHYINEVQSLRSESSNDLFSPYEFEGLAWKNSLLKSEYIRAMAAYVIHFYDRAITGMLHGDAQLAAVGMGYATTAIALLRDEKYDSNKMEAERKVRTQLGKDGARGTHIRTAALKNEAIRLYEARPVWPSRRQAAKAITPLVQKFAKEKFNRPLSPDRAEQTVYEWLSEVDKIKKQT